MLMFVLAVAGWVAFAIRSVQLKERQAAAQVTLDAVNKVGKWYEGRVAELENETRQLAEQVVLAGSFPRQAMPFPGADDGHEYAYDATGLVRETLDARDLPIS